MSADLARRVEEVCRDLAAREEPVTFAEVAERAGLSRTTLYRRTDLRRIVDEQRRRAMASQLTLPGLAVQLDQLRLSVEALAAMVRRHEEAIRRLAPSTRRSRGRAEG